MNDSKAAEPSLQQSEVSLRRVLDNLFAFVGVLTPDGTLIETNCASLEVTGLSPSDVIGKKFWDGYWCDFSAETQAALREAIDRVAQGEVLRCDMMVRMAGDVRRWIDFQLSPMRDAAGHITHLIASGTDITERKQAEEKLRESEARFRSIADSAPVLMWLNDPSDCVFVNRAYLDFLGLRHQTDVHGYGWVQYIHPEDRESYLAAFRDCRARRAPFVAEFRFRRHDGEYRWMQSVGVARLTAMEEFLGYTGCTFDIHDARMAAEGKLRESERRLNAILQTTPALVYLLDRDSRYLHVNRRFEEIFGLTADDIRGKSVQEVFPPDIAGAFEANNRRVLAECRVLEFEEETPHPSGPHCYTSVKAPLMGEDDEPIGTVGVSIDITDRKRMEEALREADRRKDEFLATLAHELRNPLVPIRNAVQIIKLKGSPDPILQSARDMIERQLHHMVRLIDDLLDVSRITRGKLELRRERVELAAVVERALEASRPYVERGGHALTVALPPQPIELNADPVRLAQVFSNLLNNACKYTEQKGHISLSAERDGTDVVAKIKDTGIGIPPEHLPYLFEMFAQVGSALDRSQGGLGIGLSLVRGLMEMHGGCVEARSEGPGRGSEFIVRLPALAETSAPRPPQPESRDVHKAVTARRILVADDIRDNAESLATLLRLAGNEVETAYDGLEAIEAAKRHRPDVVLLDIGMPKMNGYDACRAIREQPRGRNIVMVALTGWGQDEDRRKSKEAGFDGHLVKPVDPAALMALLASSLPAPGSQLTER